MKVQSNEEFLKELNENLSQTIPYKWRVQSFSKVKPSATVVAYIDARDASDVLNQYATYGWHDDYYEVGGNTYCKVGIVMPDGTVQWRSDCGTESNQDKEKGQASDAFKRACVKWGIGRFLYKLGMEYVPANEVKTDKNFPYPVDEQGKRIWDLTKYISEKRVKSTDAWKTIPATMSYITGIAQDEPKETKTALQPNTSFDNKPAQKELPKDPKVSEVIDYAVSNSSHTAIYVSDDDRKTKALLALEKTGKLHDVKQLIKLQKDFKKTEEGKAFVNGASLADVVKLNPIEMLLEFHKFLK